MKIKLTVQHGTETTDAVVTADPTAPVSAIAERLERKIRSIDPAEPVPALGVVVNRGSARERVIAPDATLGESGLRSGDVVCPTASPTVAPADTPVVGTVNVTAGPDVGKQFPIRRGTNYIGRGRDVDVRLSDPHVSKRHAKLNVSDAVEIVDDGSANGIDVGGTVVDRAVLRPGAVATLGDTALTVVLQSSGALDDAGAIAFNRSPRLDPQYVGVELKAPEPPKPPQQQRFPIAMLVAPVMMAGMLYAITRNPMSLIFVALSPIMMIGSWLETRIAGNKAFEQATAHYRSALVDLAVQLQYAADLERTGRRREHPSAAEIEEATRDLTDLVWTRRPEHDAFLQIRTGLGTQPSRNTVEMPRANDTLPELWRELVDVVGRFSTIDRVPIVADLRTVGNVGVAGPHAASSGIAANLVGQLCALHSPAELVLAGVCGESAGEWDWLKWLPHVSSEFSPLATSHLASNSSEANALVSAIEEVLAERADDETTLPAIVLFVSDDAPVERARLVQIAERGPDVGVHVVWHATSRQRLPAACRVFVECDGTPDGQVAGFVPGGLAVDDIEPERIEPGAASALARRLAPVVDSGNRTDDQSDLPRAVSFLDLLGHEVSDSPDAIVELWRANNALPLDPTADKPKRANTLRAVVGQGAAGPVHLDLRTQGPHALVGGTSGAGKSEFLQSWVLGMAAMHSPSRVTFLFVDYKGGSAFADCIDLPHCVGLVTDLSPHLVRRALTSLKAELHHREHILNRKGAKDLFELEKRNDPETPPSLVIVVDEFAALATEVPEFVDGVVDVAQRGRSLGLNLILATQRPAGVIKDNLRANTNLRVALRMADEEDSTDVIGTKQAASFDPSLPGRCVVKTGPGRLTPFQSAYVGGHTTGEPPPPNLEIRDLVFGAGQVWDAPAEPVARTDDGPVDIARVVGNVRHAAATTAIPDPRRPWLPELAATYRLDALPSPRNDVELVYGVVDHPKAQSQPQIAFLPDRDGNMAVYGTGGSGKSTFLQSIAIAAALSPARGGPCHVYGLDFGARGLKPLEELPHVGSIILGDDEERVQRLLRTLRQTVDERAERYDAVDAGSIVEYRERANRPDEPRIIVLVDGVGAFRTAYEASALSAYWELFQGLAADGRTVGVHFVVSADRPGSISTGLASSIQRRLVLRLANEMDYVMVDAPADGFSQKTPAGRGFVDGMEVQVGVLGGVSNVARQAEEIRNLAAAMARAGIAPAPPVQSLPDLVSLTELPESVNDLPVLGVWDETLAPIGFEPSGTFVVCGPPSSGKTTTVATLTRSLRCTFPKTSLVRLGQRRSPLATTVDWDRESAGASEIAAAAAELASEVTDSEPGSWAIVIESIADLLNTECDMAVQDLLKACRASDQFVIVEGETSSLAGSWPLLQLAKMSRAGIALQPDQMDGDAVFKTPFPRVARADFPFGRGLLVTGGKSCRVQVALPE